MATIGNKLSDVQQPVTGADTSSANLLCVLDGSVKQIPGWLKKINANTDAINALRSSVFNMVYPVGSIYISVNATNPSSMFGGTWEQIKDRFILAAGGSYTVGSTGGEATHKLTVDEMPKHAHDTPFFNNMTDNGEMKSDFIGVYGKGQTASQALKDMGQTSTMEMWWVNQTNNADGSEWSYLTSSKGSTTAHNNMPPYLAVYMWKRTA